jgi:hypothetical protein
LIDPTVFEKHQVGWGKEKKEMGSGLEREENRPEGKRTKTTGLYKVKDGHPTFWFFSYPFHKPVWPFFRVVPSTSH